MDLWAAKLTALKATPTGFIAVPKLRRRASRKPKAAPKVFDLMDSMFARAGLHALRVMKGGPRPYLLSCNGLKINGQIPSVRLGCRSPPSLDAGLYRLFDGRPLCCLLGCQTVQPTEHVSHMEERLTVTCPWLSQHHCTNMGSR